MTQEDDPKAYTEAFERTAIQMGLDRSQWGHQLGTLVIDQAQATYRALSREEAQDYKVVKAVILYRLEISPELQMDASGHTLGVVLLQRDGEEERPIAFASRKLSRTDTRWGSPDKSEEEARHIHEEEHQALQEAT
ncbi:hypothetical protein Y1Q_0021926 [Alligator mississippiensis]|uniref:Reverse transcriptase/retrotransposon-derived protein RNase H-like domain-containing protein n=1 Tax=Alligator mississippiensis TaxID=8496 RepID=A0A151MJD0_ALLMI|nr:hypothetical protein Y1Q_0021926 [Alligator mississippiensis]